MFPLVDEELEKVIKAIEGSKGKIMVEFGVAVSSSIRREISKDVARLFRKKYMGMPIDRPFLFNLIHDIRKLINSKEQYKHILLSLKCVNKETCEDVKGNIIIREIPPVAVIVFY